MHQRLALLVLIAGACAAGCSSAPKLRETPVDAGADRDAPQPDADGASPHPAWQGGQDGGPLSYRRFVFIGLQAAGPGTLHDWYRDIVALPADRVATFALEDGARVEITAGGLASTTTKTPAQQSVVAGLQVPNLDVAMAALEGRGLKFLGPLSSTPGEDRWRYFADPEGNRFEVKDVGAPRDGTAYEAIPWVGVYVKDLPGMGEWYANTLGLPLVASSFVFSVHRFGRGDYLELFSGGTASASRKTAAEQPIVAALEVPDVDSARAELESRGVGGWTEVSIGTDAGLSVERALEFLDPEGNRWMLKDHRR